MTARKPPRIETLVNMANRMQKPVLADLERREGKRRPETLPPSRPTPDDLAERELPKLLGWIHAALKAEKWDLGHRSYPAGVGVFHLFIEALNRRLPAPFKATENSTGGPDAYDFYTIHWRPDGCSPATCESITREVARLKTEKAAAKR